MVGRKITFDNKKNNPDVLVIAAHPDDDVIGLGTILYRHSKNNDNIKVVFVTNGSRGNGASWRVKVNESKRRSEVRFREAVQALSLINIPKENIFCLGYPDGGTQRYLKNMSEDIQTLILKFNPGRIYVHCIEGGHLDHDMTSYVVKFICSKIGYSNVFEWTEYHPKQPLGSQHVKFLPSYSSKQKEIKVDISEEERNLKRKMLAFHHSQDVEKIYLQGEAIRQANTFELEKELYEHCQLPKRKLRPIVKDLINL
ncbi:PIG-L family deacetylase [Siminovitchia acidinfaciens]|uniref:PIG-L family deacetylase n=1 Tax=Siminovitchia acidinfaciens TaxID=2321395 RepID=A0A429XW94_9BACI|nr:PIG-L family deacetylase [Siminovitchia acidinfaciens]RST72565.1 PIG-L family deacetylase [Siminovitchia acidinfaciens]